MLYGFFSPVRMTMTGEETCPTQEFQTSVTSYRAPIALHIEEEDAVNAAISCDSTVSGDLEIFLSLIPCLCFTHSPVCVFYSPVFTSSVSSWIALVLLSLGEERVFISTYTGSLSLSPLNTSRNVPRRNWRRLLQWADLSRHSRALILRLS